MKQSSIRHSGAQNSIPGRCPLSVRHAFCALLAVSSGGCHVYNPGSESLAKQIQKDFAELHVSQGLANEKKRADGMLAAEIESGRNYQAKLRDHRLTLLLDGPVAFWPSQAATSSRAATPSPGSKKPDDRKLACEPGTLVCELDERLLELVADADKGQIAQKLGGLAAAAAAVHDDIETFLHIHLDLSAEQAAALGSTTCTEANRQRLNKLVIANLPAFKDEKADAKDSLQAWLSGYAGPGGTCETLDKALGTLGSGKLGDAAKAAEAAQEALKIQDANADGIVKKYKTAKDAYDEAVKKKTGVEQAKDSLTEVRKTLNEYLGKADKADKAIAAAAGELRALGVVGDPVDLAVLETQVKSISDSIRELMSQVDTKYESSALKAVVDLLGKLQGAQKAQVLPLLLLHSEAVSGQLEAARAAAASARKQVAALKSRAEALQRAYSQLWLARLALVETGPDGSPKLRCEDVGSKTVAEAMAAAKSSTCKQAVAEAMLHYANAWTLGFGPAHEAQLTYFGEVDAGALAQSAAALQGWERVLGVPIDQLVLYHSGGVKPEEVARLVIEAAGLFGLVGTNAWRAAIGAK